MENDVNTTAVESVESETKKPYTLRRLNDEDLYPVLQIIGTVLPEDAKQAFAQKFAGENGNKGKKSVDEIGAFVVFDLGKFLLKNLGACKAEMYAFLSDVSGIPAEEIRTMPFGTTPKMLKEIFDNEKNSDFFTELSKLL